MKTTTKDIPMSLRPESSTALRCLLLLPIIAGLTAAQASTVGWYRMEGTVGDDIVSIANSSGAAASAIAEGEAFKFAGETAGTSIYDPVSDTSFANTSSTAFTGSTGHSEMTVANTPGSGPLNNADFTMEMFIRLDSRLTTGEPYLVTHGSVTTNGWGIRPRNPENSPLAFVNNGSIFNGGSEPAVIFDSAWHHLALVVKTSDDGNNYAKLYVDYNLEREVSGTSLDNYDPSVSGELTIFTEDYTGYIDEFRYSDSLLESSDFLVAIPEPGTITLFAVGLLTFYLGVRRRSKH